jgi:hypothetical protein
VLQLLGLVSLCSHFTLEMCGGVLVTAQQLRAYNMLHDATFRLGLIARAVSAKGTDMAAMLERTVGDLRTVYDTIAAAESCADKRDAMMRCQRAIEAAFDASLSLEGRLPSNARLRV